MKYLQSLFLILTAIFAFSTISHADAPLHKVLGLSANQSQQVKKIEKDYRQQMRSVRQDLKREERKLRRARLNHDSATVARQENITAQLTANWKKLRQNTDNQIRRVLSSAQKQAFEAYIQQRNAAVGSSRDAKYF